VSADPAGMHSYFDPDLMISIELPDDWQVASTDELPLVLLAPEHEGFRANIGFSERTNDPPTKEHFLALIEQLKLEQERDFDAYELVGERRAEQDGRPAFLVRSRWDLEQGPTRVAQVAALYAVTETRVIEVHCTALASLEGAYVPVFQRVLGSLRFLPTPR
jgi:hypothetical protein